MTQAVRDYEEVTPAVAPSLADLIARLEELRPEKREFDRLNRQVRQQLERRGLIAGRTYRFGEHDVTPEEVSSSGHYVNGWTSTRYRIEKAAE